MKCLFLVDESLSPVLAAKMKELGYNAKSVREAGLKGADDTEIIEWSIKNRAVIITGDLDFGELWYWHYRGDIGIIILRIKSYGAKSQYSVIKFLHENKALDDEKIRNSLIISTQNKYRIRTK
ncbi:MAG: DUF5615 family PIN-like protein [Candidatus Aenigmarchaeota archaeon]|nr:DUF5615 family PIN-like protein [Candidatus Aenigmarchaeota archaeon]